MLLALIKVEIRGPEWSAESVRPSPAHGPEEDRGGGGIDVVLPSRQGSPHPGWRVATLGAARVENTPTGKAAVDKPGLSRSPVPPWSRLQERALPPAMRQHAYPRLLTRRPIAKPWSEWTALWRPDCSSDRQARGDPSATPHGRRGDGGAGALDKAREEHQRRRSCRHTS